MTEKEKREKVIKGMESLHERLLDAAKRNSIAMLDAIIVSNALALLKAKEPRVMTLEEIVDWEGAFWLEFLEDGNESYTRYGYAFFAGSTPDVIEVIARDSFRPLYAFIKSEYGIRWRCWTSRPDEKRRAETPWN